MAWHAMNAAAQARDIDLGRIISERGYKLRRQGSYLVGPCPRCGGNDRFAINVKKRLFHCRGCEAGGSAIDLVMFLDGIGFCDAVVSLTGRLPVSQRCETGSGSGEPVSPSGTVPDQHRKASWLWSQRQPIKGSLAERYLREVRGYRGALPATLGFLRPHKPGQHPAMIGALGLCDEPEPGINVAPRDIGCVHLTLLKPDGSGKAEAETNKLIVGSPRGLPIVIAPPNDLLGLAITEGIEDALTVHQATGLGAWAGYCAGNMAKLAPLVPDYIEAVTIYQHNDENGAGQRAAAALARALNKQREIEVRIEGVRP